MPLPLIDATDYLGDSRYQQFSSIGTDTVQAVLVDAEQDCPIGVWGDRVLRGIKLLACHRLTQQQNQQAGVAIAGSVSSLNVSQGSQSVSFSGGASTAEDPEGYASTVCGQEFAKLYKGLAVTGFVI